MPKFTLTMSALSNGEIVHNSYNFELNCRITEQELVESYQEFYPAYINVKVIFFTEIEEATTAEAV